MAIFNVFWALVRVAKGGGAWPLPAPLGYATNDHKSRLQQHVFLLHTFTYC